MSVQYTKIQTILNRMKRWQTAMSVEDVYLVRDIDEALREFDRKYNWPWKLRRRSLRVFNDVLIYQVDSDFDQLAFLDNDEKGFADRARFKYTSITEFLEDVDNRNDIAEIWDGGQKFLGIRYTAPGARSRVVDSAQSDDGFTASGVAGSIAEDTVITRGGNRKSISFIVSGPGTATVESTFLSFPEIDYRRSYFFIDVYLAAVPTSVTLKIGSSSANYFSSAVTTQFSGQALTTGWNTLAFDLNTATETGTVNENAFAYQSISLAGATAGTYFIGSSYLRSWSLMDLWIYITNNIAVDGSTDPTKRYFLNEDENIFETDDRLIGEEQFVDCIMYSALLSTMSDKENSVVKADIQSKKSEAWSQLVDMYPSIEPTMITTSYRFETDFQNRGEEHE